MTNKTIILVVLTLLLCAGILTFLYSLGAIFLPLFLALVLAFLLDPVVEWLARFRINRTLAIILVFSCALGLLVVTLVFYTTSLRDELQTVQVNLPEYANRFYDLIPQPLKVQLNIETAEKARELAARLLEQVRGTSFSIFKESFIFVTRAFTSTLAFVLAVLGYLIIPLYLYYFLLDLPEFRTQVMQLLPARYRQSFAELSAEIGAIIAAFVRGQLSVCLILALLYSAGLYFIGIDLAVVIGTLAGITFIIPYVGTLLGILLSVIMAFLKFHDLVHPLLCLGWFLVVQGLEGTIITPKIVGDKVGLHPIITIVALLVGGQLFGIMGMLLAVPVTAILQVFLRLLKERYLASNFYQEG
jgi:predicted PurR-regulated permease PerM